MAEEGNDGDPRSCHVLPTDSQLPGRSVVVVVVVGLR